MSRTRYSKDFQQNDLKIQQQLAAIQAAVVAKDLAKQKVLCLQLHEWAGEIEVLMCAEEPGYSYNIALVYLNIGLYGDDTQATSALSNLYRLHRANPEEGDIYNMMRDVLRNRDDLDIKTYKTICARLMHQALDSGDADRLAIASERMFWLAEMLFENDGEDLASSIELATVVMRLGDDKSRDDAFMFLIQRFREDFDNAALDDQLITYLREQCKHSTHKVIYFYAILERARQANRAEDIDTICATMLALADGLPSPEDFVSRTQLYFAAALYGRSETREAGYQQLLKLIEENPKNETLHKTFRALLEQPEMADIKYRRHYMAKLWGSAEDLKDADLYRLAAEQLCLVAQAEYDNNKRNAAAKYCVLAANYGDGVTRKNAIELMSTIVANDVKNGDLFRQLGDCYAANPDAGDAKQCYITASRLGSVEALPLAYPDLRVENYFELIKVTDNRAAFVVFEDWVNKHPEATIQIKQLAKCYFHGYGVDRDVVKARGLDRRISSDDVIAPSPASRAGLFWHNGSYIKKLLNVASFNIMLLGVSSVADIYGAQLDLSGYRTAKAQRDLLPLVESLGRDDIEETYRANMAFANDTWDVAAFQARLAANKTVTVATGWDGHTIALSFQKIKVAGEDVVYMTYTNRGERRDGQSADIRVFRVGRPDQLDVAGIVTKLQTDHTSRDYLENTETEGSGIGVDLGLVLEASLKKSDQKIGNCSLVAAYSQVEMALMLEEAQKDDCRKGNGSPDFAKAFARAKTVYKPWRFNARVAAVKQLMSLGGGGGVSLFFRSHKVVVRHIIAYALQTTAEGGDKFSLEQRHALLDPVLAYLRSEKCGYRRAAAPYIKQITDGFAEDAALAASLDGEEPAAAAPAATPTR